MKDKMDKDGEDIFKNAQFANTLRTFKENLKQYEEQISIFAELRKYKYDMLVKVGFTEEQAERIVIKTPVLG